MHSGSPYPGLDTDQPPHYPRIAHQSPASTLPQMVVAIDADDEIVVRQALGLEGTRERVPNVAVVEQDDAVIVVVHDQPALARLRTRLPRAWQTGAFTVAA